MKTAARSAKRARLDEIEADDDLSEGERGTIDSDESDREELDVEGSANEEGDDEEDEGQVMIDTEGESLGTASKARRGRPKTAEASEFRLSVTISRKGEDLKCREYIDGLQEYAENNTLKFYMSAERGAIEKHLHFQGMAIVRTTTLAAFRKSLYKAMGYGPVKEGLKATPPGLSICLKQLSGKGLHTPIGIIGYARKEKNSQDGGEFEEW